MAHPAISPVQRRSTRVPPAVVTKVKEQVDSDSARLHAIFKDIHQHPELGFMEVRTAAIVAKELRTLGYEVQTGITRTGVAAILRNGQGPVVMYRADKGANAVEELTSLPYASKIRVKREDVFEVPVGHMCGHDAHVTWMLGMAKAMAQMKSEWGGTLVLIGQPGEELITGARAMVNDGLYTRCRIPEPDFFFGMHTAPGPVGYVANVPGVRVAGSDQIDVVFKGIGGHGSTPHLAKDPGITAAMAVVQFQVLVSPIVDPLETAVVTVGSIQAGADNNVIPGEALVKNNLCWFHPEVREKLIAGIKSISTSIPKSYGMPDDMLPVFTMKGGTTPLVNDAALVERLNVAFRDLLGERNVVEEFPPATGSEDCHLLMGDKKVPFCYVLVGLADPAVFAASRKLGALVPYANHNGNFMVDLAAIPLGTKVATVAMLDLLARN